MGTLRRMFRRFAVLTKVFDCRQWLVLVALAWCTAGCVTTLDMSTRGGEAPHTSVPYSGVRADAARFADYSVVDAAILR